MYEVRAREITRNEMMWWRGEVVRGCDMVFRCGGEVMRYDSVLW